MSQGPAPVGRRRRIPREAGSRSVAPGAVMAARPLANGPARTCRAADASGRSVSIADSMATECGVPASPRRGASIGDPARSQAMSAARRTSHPERDREQRMRPLLFSVRGLGSPSMRATGRVRPRGERHDDRRHAEGDRRASATRARATNQTQADPGRHLGQQDEGSTWPGSGPRRSWRGPAGMDIAHGRARSADEGTTNASGSHWRVRTTKRRSGDREPQRRRTTPREGPAEARVAWIRNGGWRYW